MICEKLNKKKPQLIFLNTMNTDYVDYILSEDIDIQTRHDCDDWMCDTYVDQIQKIFFKNVDNFGDGIGANSLENCLTFHLCPPKSKQRVVLKSKPS